MPKQPANEAKTVPFTVLGEASPEMKRLHELSSVYATASRDLALEAAHLEQEYLALVQRRAPYMMELNTVMERTLSALEEHVRQHPELLGEKRSLKLPVGTIKLVGTSSLMASNPDASIGKIWLRGNRVADFDATAFLRIKTTLDLQALEKLDDRVLRQFDIVRVDGDSFSFKLAAVDIKETLAAAAKQPEALAA